VVDEPVEHPLAVGGATERLAQAGSPVTSSAASSAADPDRAAASAASTSAATCAGELALPVTEPVRIPSVALMNEMTVTLMPCITPLVVSVLLAQRRLALVLSETMTMQSSAVEATKACSTSACGVVFISSLPRRWC
jgi:hypothetical protein